MQGSIAKRNIKKNTSGLAEIRSKLSPRNTQIVETPRNKNRDGITELFAKITQSLAYGEPAGGGLSTYVVKLVDSSFAVTGDEITIDHVFGYSAVQDMRDWSPWFAEDQIVKVTVSLVTGSSLYYFADTLTYLGAEADASLRFDEDDFRLKAVWQ